MPLLSFLLPGTGQFATGQYTAGMVYSSLAISGLSIIWNTNEIDSDLVNPNSEQFDPQNQDVQKMLAGNSLWMLGASLSLYHRFRDAATTWYDSGDFLFLRNQEGVADVTTAPLRFSHLGRWTSYAPLGVLSTLLIAAYLHPGEDTVRFDHLRLQDGGMIGLVSYEAGVAEEALFRGWLMPVMYHNLGSGFWSNLLTSALFAAAHYSGEKEFKELPWPQFALGFYFGWLTQRNRWTISEAVFVHTWWDILAFLATFTIQPKKENSIYIPLFFSQY